MNIKDIRKALEDEEVTMEELERFAQSLRNTVSDMNGEINELLTGIDLLEKANNNERKVKLIEQLLARVGSLRGNAKKFVDSTAVIFEEAKHLERKEKELEERLVVLVEYDNMKHIIIGRKEMVKIGPLRVRVLDGRPEFKIENKEVSVLNDKKKNMALGRGKGGWYEFSYLERLNVYSEGMIKLSLVVLDIGHIKIV